MYYNDNFNYAFVFTTNHLYNIFILQIPILPQLHLRFRLCLPNEWFYFSIDIVKLI